jgi:signal peptidase II
MKAVPASRYVCFLLLAVAGCGADLWTKDFMFRWLGMPPSPTEWVIDGIFGWQTSLNHGALFGVGQGQGFVFISLSVVAAIGIIYWLFVMGAAEEWLLTISLGAIMGGIFGNMYDRLGLWEVPGHPGVHEKAVRDWILVQYNGWVWPNFNIADSLLVCGAATLLWHATFSPSQQAKAAETTPSAKSPS